MKSLIIFWRLFACFMDTGGNTFTANKAYAFKRRARHFYGIDCVLYCTTRYVIGHVCTLIKIQQSNPQCRLTHVILGPCSCTFFYIFTIDFIFNNDIAWRNIKDTRRDTLVRFQIIYNECQI